MEVGKSLLPKPTHLVVRCLRVLRLAVHLAAGLGTMSFRFPGLSAPRRRAEVRRWSHKLLTILGVRIHAANHPAALPPCCMLVTNHISWLDVFVVLASHPSVFVAKSEIRGWPVVGWLCERAGTLFIERGNRGAARRVNAAIVAALQKGTVVSVYPEGTTSDGRRLGRFHAALFQPAIDAGATLLPLALCYTDRNGRHCSATDFVGETSFAESLWSTTSARHIVADLQWLAPVDCSGRERRELARETAAAIAAALRVPADVPIAAPASAARHSHRSEPGKDAGPEGESR